MSKELLEIWHPVPGFETLSASNYGRIKKHILDKKTGTREWVILDQKVNSSGYRWVMAKTKNKNQIVLSHRIIALAFLTNPHGFPVVNHKNRDRSDNSVENLEWCSYAHNCTHKNCVEDSKRITLSYKKSKGAKVIADRQARKCWVALKSITDNQKEQIVNEYNVNNRTVLDLAKTFNIRPRSVIKLIFGSEWQYTISQGKINYR